MVIIHSVGDLGFSAKTTEELYNKLREHYTFMGYTPEIEIKGDCVIVTIDNDKFERTRSDFEKAVRLCNEGKLDKAKSILEDVIKVCPLHSDALRNLAQIKFMRVDYQGALKDCDAALKVNPKDHLALLLSGNIYHATGNTMLAEIYWKGASKYAPGDPVIMCNLAALAANRKDYDEALRIANECLDKDDTYANVWYLRTAVMYNSGRLNAAFESGVEGLKKSVDRPENPGVRRNLLNVTLQIAETINKRTDWWDIAINRYKKSLEIEDAHNIELADDQTLAYNGKMEYRIMHNRDENRMVYNSSKPYIEHVILHELTHLKFAIDNTKADAGMVVSSPADGLATFEASYGFGMRKAAPKLSKEEQDKFIRHFYNMIGQRIMSSALDLFVEDTIYNEFPAVRPLQMLSLYVMEKEAVESDNAPLAKSLPPALVAVSHITNSVQSMQLKELYGIDLIADHLASTKDLKTAESMYDSYKIVKRGYDVSAEYDLVQTFAEELHMEDFIKITPEKEFVKEMYGVTRDDIQRMIDEGRRKQAEQFKLDHNPHDNPVEGMMISMYMLAALQYFDGKSKMEVGKVGRDIAILGLTGISPSKKSGYKVASIPDKDFGGYELLAFYYVSWALAFPQMLPSLNLPYDDAYETAKMMFSKKK